MEQESYSTQEVAKLLGLPIKKARSLLRDGVIKSEQHRLTGRWKVRQEDIVQYLNEQKEQRAKSHVVKHRVLVVDDDVNVVNTIRRTLTKNMSNLIVETCKDGFEALVSIGKQPPDLLILDNRMPKTMGKNVLHAVRKNPNTKAIKVLVVVGNPDDLVEMMEIGADDALEKPFSTSMLIVKTTQLLHRSKKGTVDPKTDIGPAATVHPILVRRDS